MRRSTSICTGLCGLLLLLPLLAGAFPLQYVEDFSSTAGRDAGLTTAVWDTVLGQVRTAELPFTVEATWPLTISWLEVAGTRGFARVASTVEILDLSDPIFPATLGSVDWAPQLVTPECAAYEGRYLLIGTETLVSLFPRVVRDRLEVWDVQNPASPAFVGSALLSGVPQDIEAVDGVAWVAIGAAGVQGVDLSDPTAPVVGAPHAVGEPLDRIARSGDRLILGKGGVNAGIEPAYFAGGTSLSGGGWGLGGCGMSDLVVDGMQAYIVGSNCAWYVDLPTGSIPSSPTWISWSSAPRCIEADGHWIAIGEEDGSVEVFERVAGQFYSRTVVSTSSSPPVDLIRRGQRLLVLRSDGSVDVLRFSFDLADGQPVQVATWGVASGSSPNFEADLQVVGDRLYLVGAASSVGLRVFDLGSPSSPQLLGSQGVGSSRLYRRVSVERERAWILDYNRVVCMDVTVPSAMFQVSIVSPGVAFGLRDVFVRGGLLYLLGQSDLRVYDVTDAYAPTLVGGLSLTLPADLDHIVANGSLLYLTDRSGWGMRVVDVSDPAAPSLAATIASIKGDLQVAIDGNRLITAGLMVSVYDISHPLAPATLRSSDYADWTAGARGLAVEGDRAYVTDLNGEMWIYDLGASGSVPLVGRKLWGVAGSGDSWGMAVSGDHAFRYAWQVDGGFMTQQLESLFVRRRWRDPMGTRAVSKGIVQDTRSVRAVRILATTTGNVNFSVETGMTWTGTSSVAVTPGPNWTFLDPAVAPGNVFGHLRWSAELIPDALDPDPTLSDLRIEWLYEEPRIVGWSDVPADEGGAVSLSFTRSAYDAVAGSWPAVSDSYRVWQEPASPGAGANVVAKVAPTGNDVYQTVAPVLADSVFGGPLTLRTGLYVTTTLSSAPLQTISPTVLVFGIDNLDPAASATLIVNYAPWDGPNVLGWAPSVAPDVDHYRVYRATDPGLLDLALVDSTQTLSWSDPLYQQPGVYYAVDVVDDAGRVSSLTLTSTVTAAAPVPTTSRLLPAAPNPFNPRTTIRFDLAHPEVDLRLEIFDARGRRVTGLAAGSVEAGSHRVVWNGVDALGRPVASGLYFVRLKGASVDAVEKVVLAK